MTTQSGSAASQKKKKSEATKGRCRVHFNRRPFAPSQRSTTSAISESTNARGKNPFYHVGDRHGVLDSRSGKEGVVRLNKLE